MYPDDPLHVCRDCPAPHYDNCPDCFGFGVYHSTQTGDNVPVSAGQAMRRPGEPEDYWCPPLPDNVMPCPTCGSTVKGVPADKGA